MSVSQVPLWSMPASSSARPRWHARAGRGQVAALKLSLLAEAERSGATTESGANTAADWVAVETRQVRRDARSDLRLAQALEHHQVLSAAMGQGRVNVAQARAIVAALDKLPATGEFAVSARPTRAGRDLPGR